MPPLTPPSMAWKRSLGRDGLVRQQVSLILGTHIRLPVTIQLNKL